MLILPMRMLRPILLPVLGALLALSPAVPAIDTIPARLSDAAFWKLVTDSSESGGEFLSEDFVSNELGYQYVISAVRGKVQPGGAYLGVGPEQNFTYIAAFHPRIAFIVDIRRQNMIEHLLYKAIFELSRNRVEFLSVLFSRRPTASLPTESTARDLFATFAESKEDPELYRENVKVVEDLLVNRHHFALSKDDESSLEHVYQEFATQGGNLRYSVSSKAVIPGLSLCCASPSPASVDPDSSSGPRTLGFHLLTWADPCRFLTFPSYAEVMTATDAYGRNWSYLSTEEGYQFVRQMQRTNSVIPVVGDFAGPKALRVVGRYLREHDSTVSVFYVSNVEQYLTPGEKLQSFYENVSMLPLNASSTFIRSIQSQGIQPGVAQSSIDSIQKDRDAVLSGAARNIFEILRLPN